MHFHNFNCKSLLIGAAISLMVCTPVLAAVRGVVTDNGVNLRSGASTEYEVIAKFAGDTKNYNEIENMAQRIYAARLLKNGETYNSVMEKTNLASATVARVSNCVKYGKGYDKFIK